MSRGVTDATLNHVNGITGLQLAIGILVGALYAANHFKGRIKAFFKSLFRQGEKHPETEE